MTALLITIITAAVWYAFWNLGKGLEARGYVRGYRKAVQDRAKDILKAKFDGALAERARWVAASRLDLTPLPDQFARDEYVRLAQERAEQASEHDTANALMVAFDGMVRDVKANCNPEKPTTAEAVERATT